MKLRKALDKANKERAAVKENETPREPAALEKTKTILL